MNRDLAPYEDRQCLRRNGKPKKIFPNRGSAENALAILQANLKGDIKRVGVYHCRQGHWHIGKSHA